MCVMKKILLFIVGMTAVISFSGYAHADKGSKPQGTPQSQPETTPPAHANNDNDNNEEKQGADNNGRNEGPFITGVINAAGTPNNIPEENPAQNSPN